MKQENKKIWATIAIVAMAALLLLGIVPAVAAESVDEQNVNSLLNEALAQVNGRGGFVAQSADSGTHTRDSIISLSSQEPLDDLTVLKGLLSFGKCEKFGLTIVFNPNNPGKVAWIKQPGQAIRGGMYQEEAIFNARQGRVAVLVDRPETFITDKSQCTKADWGRRDLLDNYYVIVVSRAIVATLNNLDQNGMSDIVVVEEGHSAGASITTDYKASKYDDFPFGKITVLIPEDMIVVSKNETFRQIQHNRLNEIDTLISQGEVYSNETEAMIQVTYLALNRPDENDMSPYLTNIQMWREMIVNASLYDPTVPEGFRYLAGDITGLNVANETEVMISVLENQAPYTPLKQIRRYVCLMAGDCELNPERIDGPTLYVGLGTGFSIHGASWFIEDVGLQNPDISVFNWRKPGHAGNIFDPRAYELRAIKDLWIDEQVAKLGS